MGCGSSNNKIISINIEKSNQSNLKLKDNLELKCSKIIKLKDELKKKSDSLLKGNDISSIKSKNYPSNEQNLESKKNSFGNILNNADNKEEEINLNQRETIKTRLRAKKSCLKDSVKKSENGIILESKTISFSNTIENKELCDDRNYKKHLKLIDSLPNTIANAGKKLYRTKEYKELIIENVISEKKIEIKTKGCKAYKKPKFKLVKIFYCIIKMRKFIKILKQRITKNKFFIRSIDKNIRNLEKLLFNLLLLLLTKIIKKNYKHKIIDFSSHLDSFTKGYKNDKDFTCQFHKDDEYLGNKDYNNNTTETNIHSILDKYLYSKINNKGSGHNAKVFIGNDKEGKIKYAIKIISKLLNSKNCCDNEIKAYRKIYCFDYIVRVYDIQETKDKCYFVMEYMDHNLLDLIISESKSNSNSIIDDHFIRMVIRSIIYALEYLHEEIGIAHLDIHPKNILVSKGLQKIKLTDFGLSAELDNLTETFSSKNTNNSTITSYIKNTSDVEYDIDYSVKFNSSPSSFNTYNSSNNLLRNHNRKNQNFYYKLPFQPQIKQITKYDYERLKKDNYFKYFLNDYNKEDNPQISSEFYKSIDIWMLGITIYNMINGDKSISDFKTLVKTYNFEFNIHK